MKVDAQDAPIRIVARNYEMIDSERVRLRESLTSMKPLPYLFWETFLPLALQKTAETSPGGVHQSRFVFEYRANILACNTNKFQ